MNREIYIKGIASLLFAGAVALFFGVSYPHHLHYQEQLQLFLLTPEYGMEKVAHPGGIAEYIGEFLTQFYFQSGIGAGIIAALLMATQLLVARAGRDGGLAGWAYPLSFLPAIGLWAFLCDENALPAFPVAVALTLTGWLGWRGLPRGTGQVVGAALLTPLLYWIAGGACWLFALGTAAALWRMAGKGLGQRLWMGLVPLAVGALCPLIARGFVQYPLESLFMGIDFYRFPGIYPATIPLTLLLAATLPLLPARLPWGGKSERMGVALASIAVIGIGFGWISRSADYAKEEIMRYDYLTRMKRWEEIIRMAERKTPRSPLSVTCLNLALAKSGQLGDRMFHFFQNGTEGLIPAFQRDFTAPLPASEVFYHIGMINSAQRYTFEAMEAIPDFKKSGRAYLRLAETNLINGEYAVAAKYLRALRHTLFYRRWAEQRLAMLHDEASVNAHPEYGALRRMRYEEDFLFSDTEMESMLGLLLKRNPKNRLAFEYLLAHALQRKDLERFMQYYPLGKEMGYDHIPLSYQEALVFVWTQRHPDFKGLPWSISRPVLEGVTEFARVYTTQRDAEPLLRPRFEKTFWYYLLFRK